MKIALKAASKVLFVTLLVQVCLLEGLTKQRSTGVMGGVENISEQDLQKMQESPYILHARENQLTKVPAEKAFLPKDPKGHPQGANVTKIAGDTLFVIQPTTVSVSNDGGRSWKSHRVAEGQGHWQVLNDGTFIRVSMESGEKATGPAQVFRSTDQGRSWKPMSEFAIEIPGGYKERYSHWGVKKLPDDTLFYGMDVRDEQFEGEPWRSVILSGSSRLVFYRSDDGGQNWEGPIQVCQWCSEGGIVQLPSGNLFATIRFQRGLLPTDPPDVLDGPGGKKLPYPYKHLFTLESQDRGRTWGNHRQLTTVFGQCYGYPAVQRDGTVVAIHDTRYGPLPDAARAMISYDSGKTWEDEVYYLFYGKTITGYSHSVTLSDDTIVTVGGFSDYTGKDAGSWKSWIGNSRLVAVRWKPRKKESSSLSQREERQRALHSRQRRVIFDDDSYELDREDANTPEGFLKRRLQPLVGTDVTTISWSVLGGWADAPVYDSKVQSIYGEAHGGPPVYWPAAGQNVQNLIQSGRGPLQVVIDFAHQNGMEVFASIRMNDVHDSFLEGGITLWKKQHPEYLVKTEGKPPISILYDTAQDYSHDAVRERKFEIIDEICSRYDIEGISLDFIRHPVLFSSVMQGGRASKAEVRLMSDFVRRIRGRMEELAQRRGKPLLLSARIPDSFELSLGIGLDIRTWLQEDLVDILVVGGGYAPFSLSVDKIANVAHNHKIAIYPCINTGALTAVTSQSTFRYGVWALAHKWYSQGANGVYLFNLGSPGEYKYEEELQSIRTDFYSSLDGLLDPGKIASKTKLYAINGPHFNFKGSGPPYAFISGKVWLPVELKSQSPVELPITVADDLSQSRPSGSPSKATLRLWVRHLKEIDDVVAHLNGERLSGGELFALDNRRIEHWLDFSLDPMSLRVGDNKLRLEAASTETPVAVQRVHLWLR